MSKFMARLADQKRDWGNLHYQRFKSIDEKFWEKVDIRGDNKCWNWLAYKTDRGEGQFVINKKSYPAKNVAYQLVHGWFDNDDDWFVYHVCGDKSCVNPLHLSAIPAKDKSEYSFWKRVDIKDTGECWEWLGYINTDGYGSFHWIDTKQNLNAHRFSWILHFGDIEPGYEVCHHCDNPSCVNPKHLFLGTHQDNINDMWEKGRANPRKGENHPKAKLSKKDVLEIQKLLQTEMTHKQIGDLFGISRFTIGDINTGRSWKHLK